MLVSHKIELTDEQYILDFYKEDVSLNKYFQRPTSSSEEMAKIAFETLQHSENFKFFEVLDENDTSIGFFGVEKDFYINTFFIRPSFRAEYKDVFWNEIKKQVMPTFYAGLYCNNTRAIKYYLNMNGKIVEANSNILVFQFKD